MERKEEGDYTIGPWGLKNGTNWSMKFLRLALSLPPLDIVSVLFPFESALNIFF